MTAPFVYAPVGDLARKSGDFGVEFTQRFCALTIGKVALEGECLPRSLQRLECNAIAIFFANIHGGTALSVGDRCNRRIVTAALVHDARRRSTGTRSYCASLHACRGGRCHCDPHFGIGARFCCPLASKLCGFYPKFALLAQALLQLAVPLCTVCFQFGHSRFMFCHGCLVIRFVARGHFRPFTIAVTHSPPLGHIAVVIHTLNADRAIARFDCRNFLER